MSLTIALLTQSVPAAAATHTLIISGLGGDPEYERRFEEQAVAIAEVHKRLAERADYVVKLTGKEVNRDSIRREIKALAARATAQDAATVVLIGHGTYDGEEYRFNIPGPDLTGSELKKLLAQLRAKEQLIVNATSASGAILEQWSQPGRVLITATKSGAERTATRFTHYWMEALTSDKADLDKDEIITATEAFQFAADQVAAHFKADVALATEHARLEGEDAAKNFTVARSGVAIDTANPAVSALLAQREALERNLEEIKRRKASLEEEAYYDALEAVLVEFALLQQRIDAQQTSARTVPP